MALPGSEVRARTWKWDGTPHWTYETVVLGEDEHGTWLGSAVGTRFERPGASYRQTYDCVHLVGDDWCLPTFYGPGAPVAVYVDVATVPDLDDGELHLVDLDLDVVRGWSGRTWVDDEDEFAAHRVSLGYPERVVDAATASCERVRAAVVAGRAPYDGTARAWLAQLSSLSGRSSGR